MSFAITFQCPRHPTYQAKVRPATLCPDCRLMFAVRNSVNRAISTPIEERTDADERIIKEIVSGTGVGIGVGSGLN